MKKFLIAIVIIAALTRLLFLGQFPNGFTGDEAQQGYSAYSLLQTGKDEWGEVLPLFPRGFGDFKPSLYTYVSIPTVGIFGLTVEAVRLPAALAGILAVYVVFLLTRELLKDEKTAILASLFLSISPWHIQLSRSAFEASLGVLTFSLGLLFYLKSGARNFILAAFFWGLTLYSYHSWRAFLIFFILGLLVFYRKKLIVKKNLVPGVILLIFILPLLVNINSVLTRSSDVSVFSQKQLEGYFASREGSPLPPTLDRAFDYKLYFIGSQFVSNYLSYFSPTFYFTSNRSDNTYLNFPYFPLIPTFEIIFWLLTFYIIITKNFENRKIFLLWFLLAIIPASLAIGGMNANRALTLLPLTAIISAIGAKILLTSKNWIKYLLGALLVLNFLMFLHFYFIKLPKTPPANLRYGYQEVFKKVLEVESKYDNVVFSKAFTEPHIFVAFYGKMNPKGFQAASQDWLRYEKAGRQYIDQLESWNLGKYLFEDIYWGRKDSLRKNTLVVAEPKDFTSEVESILDVKDPKGVVLFRLVPTNVD